MAAQMSLKDSSFNPLQGLLINEVNFGRWFLMDAGDFDQDSDEDLILSFLPMCLYRYRMPLPNYAKEKCRFYNFRK